MTQGIQQARRYCSLLGIALAETEDVTEALLAADLALSIQPEPENGMPTVHSLDSRNPPDIHLAFDIENRRAQIPVTDRIKDIANQVLRMEDGE